MTENKQGAYAGESDAKRLARVDLYSQTARLWKEVQVKPKGWAVLLAGPEAAEVGAVRHLLKWPADQVLFVDTDPTGLRVAEARWPGVQTLRGDIREVLDALHGESVGFAHLDFMGHLNPMVEETVRLLRDKLTQGGVLAYTFLRGREHEGQKNWDRARAIARDLMDANKCNPIVVQMVKEHYRCFGYAGILKDILGDKNMSVDLGQPAPQTEHERQRKFAMMHMTRYSSKWSPMGVIGLQKAMPGFVGEPWRKALELCGVDQPLKISKKEAPDRVRDWAVKFRRDGLPHSTVGEIFNVQPATVSAWLAHDTRGTYREKTETKMQRTVHRWTDDQEAQLLALVDKELKPLFERAEKERRTDDAWAQIPGRLGVLVTPAACKEKYNRLKAALEVEAKKRGNGHDKEVKLDSSVLSSVMTDIGSTVVRELQSQTTDITKEVKGEAAVLRNIQQLLSAQFEGLRNDLKWTRQAIVDSNKEAAKQICASVGEVKKDVGSLQAAMEIINEQLDTLLTGLKEAP